MPYCSGCGSRYQEGDKVCKSCGFELMEDVDPKTAGKSSTATAKKERATAVTKKPTRKKKINSEPKSELTEVNPQNTTVNETETPQVAAAPPRTPDNRQLQSEVIPMPSGALNDIHLGKGIIKPKAVEVGLDGFHFKYEDQPHSFKKTDSFSKEHSTELRVVNPDFDKERVEPAVINEMAQVEEVKLQPELPETPVGRGEEQSKLPEADNTEPPADSNRAREDDTDNVENVLQDTLEAELREMVALLEESEVEAGAESANLQADLEEQLLEHSDEPISNVSDVEKSPSPAAPGPEPLAFQTLDPISDGVTELAAEPETSTLTGEAVDNGQLKLTQPIDGVEVCQAQETTVIINDNAIVSADTVQVQNVAVAPSGTIPGQQTVNILWQGHQSWFGIPLPAHICLSEQHLTLTEQNGHIVEITVDQIKQITVKQSWLAKLLGIGDLIIDLKQRVPSRQVLTGVSNPVKLRTLLEDLASKAV